MRIFSLPMMLIFLEIFIKKHLSQVCKLYVKFEININPFVKMNHLMLATYLCTSTYLAIRYY